MKVRNSNKGGRNKHNTWFHHQQEIIRNKREKDISENMQRKGARKAKPGKQGLI
ncbi:hypothetical protein BDZ91DRAFT_754870 [Kalaharituber pfeilii]|nr:hypothetical protein BDZ91DRAFT_754870 [Kalaharituber pfeilii]